MAYRKTVRKNGGKKKAGRASRKGSLKRGMRTTRKGSLKRGRLSRRVKRGGAGVPVGCSYNNTCNSWSNY